MNYRGLVLIAWFCLIAGTISAQHLKPSFAQTRQEIFQQSAERKQRVKDFLMETGMEATLPLSGGRIAYMVDVIEGRPVYVAGANADASRMVGIDGLRPGGSLGLNLEGEGMKIWIWDTPLGPRLTHQEYAGRVVEGFDKTDAERSLHTTHVTGTILNSGIDPGAKGMAPKATAVVFDFTDDVEEIIIELASNAERMAISNHSYARMTGWEFVNEEWQWVGNENISAVEDALFGFYTNEAREYDQIARDAPNYLMVYGSGNNRGATGGDGGPPADGPYDIIPSTINAKNILVVGATRKLNEAYSGPESVEMSDMSGWGPTDDGRIKPDISAPGVGIRSSNSDADDSYFVYQGTSPSTAVVSGGLLLIQELNQKLHGQFMRSAALKALAIHTALETGRADGPDYEYGWGFFNADGIARLLIEENHENKDIIIGDLSDGETDTYTITPDAGTKVKITMAWTDVPGTPVSLQLDPQDLMLVNDLDMRVSGATETHMPWIMNPASPADAATKGDNFRDNVEKIEFTAVDDSYTITINHKNDIEEGTQEYALIIEYINADASKSMYWVGNSGEWNNPSNWSFSSGGTSANSLPTANDRVVFDENSFSGIVEGENFTISLQSNVEVAGFRWFTEKKGAFAFEDHQITLGGDLVVLSENLSFGTGNVILGGQEGTLNVNGALTTTDLLVNTGENGSYRLVNELNANTITVQSGELVLDNSQVTTATMALDGGAMSADNSEINVTSSFSISNSFRIGSFTNSEFKVPAEAQNVNFDFNTISQPVKLNVLGTARISGTGIDELEVNNRANLIGDFTVETLQIGPSGMANISDGNTLSVNAAFNMVGTNTELAQLVSSGTASLNITGHRKVCANFMSVDGVNYVGEASLTIGETSTVAGDETGWNQVACENLLFADFDFDFGCTNSLTQFNNLSSGQITGQTWNFGESGNGVVDSEAENPTYTFATAGLYDVKLTVTDADDTFEYTGQSQIIDNTIEQFGVNQPVEGVLVSDVEGQSYQWYLNGNALSGDAATNRQLAVTQSGIYSVLVADETCNRFSNEFTVQVTSIDVDREEQEKVEEAVKVFPNPARDYIDAAIDGYNLRKVAMELVDQSGKVVTNSRYENINSQSFSERLNLPDVRQGFYILRFIVNEGIIVNRKVILTE